MAESEQDRITRSHWEQSATTTLDDRSLRPVAPDPHLQGFLEQSVTEFLKPEWRCLDLGCGDGVSTLRFAKHVKSIVGVDYIPHFVKRANETARSQGVPNASFLVGDARNLATLELARFDAIITIRCLINLGGWENQKTTIRAVANSLFPGGLYLACEGWEEGVENLSKIRQAGRLSEFKVANFNVFISRRDFETETGKYFEILDYRSIGFYAFMSRVFQPLMIQPEAPTHTHPVNVTADRLMYLDTSLNKMFEKYDYAGMYVLRKR
jgi:SAM-dependent methyltransferase